ncbi:YfbM family protein [Myceligenerans indicum]|uniref:YfbM family protein n=1 Tax=Myceligenerans indicum TaxID=2593663 RepID=A0ABS1LIT2_9MICO|nr:YfbM family protein [Myceligenerans indicum]MBL0886033.1 YfbM family protein [Myceligenerans indicum]
MSMIGEYVRLAPGDLEKALSDPEWAWELVDELLEADEGDPRLFDVDKAWHGLALVLDRAGLPSGIIFGDGAVPGADDWGYGPPSSLGVARVGELAAALDEISPIETVRAVPGSVLAAEGIYPKELWEEPTWAEYLIGHLEGLKAFFREATDSGMGMLVWLD